MEFLETIKNKRVRSSSSGVLREGIMLYKHLINFDIKNNNKTNNGVRLLKKPYET